MRDKKIQLTEEEKAAGATLMESSRDDDFVTMDVSDKKIEQMARGFIMGNKAIGRRKEVREELEDRVTKRIGKKGKYLTDKLFELIDGVYTVQKESGKEIRYYKVPPNLTAIIYALDRVLGKPKQHIEKSEEKKGIILVEHVIRNLASNPYKKMNHENGTGKNNVGGNSGNGQRSETGQDGIGPGDDTTGKRQS